MNANRSELPLHREGGPIPSDHTRRVAGPLDRSGLLPGRVHPCGDPPQALQPAAVCGRSMRSGGTDACFPERKLDVPGTRLSTIARRSHPLGERSRKPDVGRPDRCALAGARSVSPLSIACRPCERSGSETSSGAEDLGPGTCGRPPLTAEALILGQARGCSGMPFGKHVHPAGKSMPAAALWPGIPN